jgi:[ribosomal protein S5]-alanine N-acetyltransferase
MENTEKLEIQISTKRLQRETVSMKYIQEIFKEFTDDVTKRLRTSTPKTIEEEYARVERSIEKYKNRTDVNFTVTDKEGNFIG